MQWIDETHRRDDVTPPPVGAKVQVNYWIREGEKKRVQAFEGVVLCCHRRKAHLDAMFTVRKVSQGYGVERQFSLHSPLIESIVVKSQGRIRRAKLYYLRALKGRKARLREINA